MPGKRPPYLPGHYYHFYNRGAHRWPLFREEANYYFVLGKIREYALSLKLTLIAYCLMPNHYHFLIRQDGDQPAGLLLQRVFNSYTKAYNKRYHHSGTLFEGNYDVVPVQEESYLRHLCRYIHANPVKAGLVKDPAEWDYSNYREWMGKRDYLLVDRDFIRAHFGSPERYREYLFEYLRAGPGAFHLSDEVSRYEPSGITDGEAQTKARSRWNAPVRRGITDGEAQIKTRSRRNAPWPATRPTPLPPPIPPSASADRPRTCPVVDGARGRRSSRAYRGRP